MTQHLTDLRQRRALAQHVSGQGMPKLMRAAMRRINLGTRKRVVHDRADAVGSIQQGADRSQGAQEYMTVFAHRAAPLQIGSDSNAYVSWQWQ